MRRYLAPAVVIAGAAVIFAGLFIISPVAAFVILAGAMIVLLGLTAIEVPQP